MSSFRSRAKFGYWRTVVQQACSAAGGREPLRRIARRRPGATAL